MRAARVVDRLDLVPGREVPTISAYGGGFDSTAMVIRLIERNTPPTLVLHADMSDEEPPECTDYVKMFGEYLDRHGVEFHIVRYKPKHYKQWPPYNSLYTNLLVNGTLPGVTFGRASCSVKWKAQNQHNWTKNWRPAVDTWARGGKVIKQIGYSASKRDLARRQHAEHFPSDLYLTTYPLQDEGIERSDTPTIIRRAGLPLPRKTACSFCISASETELHSLPKPMLRRIVLLEARAMPRLGPSVRGLWRRARKGARGTTPRPALMTDYIRSARLLPAHEIDVIWEFAPKALTSFISMAGDIPLEERPAVREWLELFDRVSAFDTGFDLDGMPPLMADLRMLAEAGQMHLAA